MMNVPNPWPGLGYSLLNPKYNNIDLNKRWDVSEWLLLSNFFDSSRMCYW